MRRRRDERHDRTPPPWHSVTVTSQLREERLLDIINEFGSGTETCPDQPGEIDADEVTQAALTRWLRNIGEIAGQLSMELRSQHIGMRHRMVQDYFSINLSVVWCACMTDMSSLYLKLITSSGICKIPLVRATREPESAPTQRSPLTGANSTYGRSDAHAELAVPSNLPRVRVH